MVLGIFHERRQCRGERWSVCHIDVCGYGPAAGEYPLTLGGGWVYVGEVGFNNIAGDALAICSEAKRES